jgi:phenylacetate-CoA ligase
MSFVGSIVRNVIYPAWLLREGQYGILPTINDIEAAAAMSRQRLRERQFRLLRDSLDHAYKYSPYYTRLFDDHGFSPSKLQDFADLKKLPVLTKKEINQNREQMVSAKHRDARDIFASKTGGSTGTPMKFYRDKRCLVYRRALDHYLDQTIGFRIGDKQVLLWGNPSDIPLEETGRRRLMERLIWRRISYLPIALDDSA